MRYGEDLKDCRSGSAKGKQMEKALEIKNLSKLYRNKRGVREISLAINPGEIYGLLGPNGAGKTTIMKLITGLCRADQGEVRIWGYDLVKQFEQAMASVGCIIESADAYTYLSAYRNLELATRFYPGLPKTRIDEVLTLVGLSEFKTEIVANYSLGMKQRLGLAGALLSRPRLMILDEPTNGLDIAGMADIRNTIIQLAQTEKITFLVSSHLAHEMELMCHRVAVIDQGRLIKEAAVSEILAAHVSLESFFIQQTKGDRGDIRHA